MAKTELTPRKQDVLNAVVKAYIETGEPVGSKALLSLLAKAPSSATLRNEMNELCSMGFLNQPHTSAGRVPTSNGYRHYLKSLIGEGSLDEETKRYIDLLFKKVSADLNEMPRAAAEIISSLTGLPSLFYYSVEKSVFLKRVELLPMGRRGTIILAVASDARTEYSICRLQNGISAELQQRFNKVLKERLLKRPLSEFDCAYLQNVVASAGLDSLDLMPLITEIFSLAERLNRKNVGVAGMKNLYNICSFDTAAEISALIEREDTFLRLLDFTSDKTEVLFGSETGFSPLQNQSIILSNYKIGDKYSGKIGIIGNSRMSYEKIIPTIEYIALILSEKMGEAQMDMED